MYEEFTFISYRVPEGQKVVRDKETGEVHWIGADDRVPDGMEESKDVSAEEFLAAIEDLKKKKEETEDGVLKAKYAEVIKFMQDKYDRAKAANE